MINCYEKDEIQKISFCDKTTGFNVFYIDELGNLVEEFFNEDAFEDYVYEIFVEDNGKVWISDEQKRIINIEF